MFEYTNLKNYRTRKGLADDKDWLYSLYRMTLRTAIEKTWGWDESFQRHEFNNNLSPDKFQILCYGNQDIGGYCLHEYDDHLWLEMLFIHPNYQRKGFGGNVIKDIQHLATRKNKAIKLGVIKVNPVSLFYEKLGFKVYETDGSFYRMVWSQ